MKSQLKYLSTALFLLLMCFSVSTLQAQDETKSETGIKISKEVLETYLGDYMMGKDTLHIVMEGEVIKAKGPGHPPLSMKALKENRFLLKRFGVDVEFVKGDDGKIEKLLMIRADGQQLEAPKID